MKKEVFFQKSFLWENLVCPFCGSCLWEAGGSFWEAQFLVFFSCLFLFIFWPPPPPSPLGGRQLSSRIFLSPPPPPFFTREDRCLWLLSSSHKNSFIRNKSIPTSTKIFMKNIFFSALKNLFLSRFWGRRRYAPSPPLLLERTVVAHNPVSP